MTREEIVEGLKLLEDNMVYFDELQNDKGEWIDVHELLFEAIQALSQEPCDDAISRSGAVKAIEERAKRIKNEDTLNGLAGAVGILFELPSVTQKPIECNDAISRQAVLDLINADWKYEGLETDIASLPPVTPKPKTGHWIHFAQSDDCSLCGYSTGKYGSPSKFCPNCGAEMESEE